MKTIDIRPMDLLDLQAVLVVEKNSFTTPWTKKIFEQELTTNEHAHYFVIEREAKIIGYAGLWIVEENAQITSIAIHPEHRRHHFGEKLLKYLMYYALNLGVQRMSLEVRVSNISAQKMYRKFGFIPAGIHENYYEDNEEDAIIMWVNLV